MYAVIFTADTHQLDDSYSHMANNLRELALSHYGCLEFNSISDINREISISFWNSLDDIKAWKNDATHIQAQKTGKQNWYSHYRVQITEIIQHYEYNSNTNTTGL